MYLIQKYGKKKQIKNPYLVLNMHTYVKCFAIYLLRWRLGEK